MRVDDDPYGKETQFDDTELPQHRVWLDTYEIDRDEVSLAEYLAYLHARKLHPSVELQKLIWHVITVHSVRTKPWRNGRRSTSHGKKPMVFAVRTVNGSRLKRSGKKQPEDRTAICFRGGRSYPIAR